MDSDNRRQLEQLPADGAGKDSRLQLGNDTRQKIINKIVNTLRVHLPSCDEEGVQELKKIGTAFEEKIYQAATTTSQSEYLRRISLKMLKVENTENLCTVYMVADFLGVNYNQLHGEGSAIDTLQSM